MRDNALLYATNTELWGFFHTKRLQYIKQWLYLYADKSVWWSSFKNFNPQSSVLATVTTDYRKEKSQSKDLRKSKATSWTVAVMLYNLLRIETTHCRMHTYIQRNPTSILAPENIFWVTFSINTSQFRVIKSLKDPADWESDKQQG